MVQWIVHLPSDLKVPGSNPGGDILGIPLGFGPVGKRVGGFCLKMEGDMFM